MKATKNKERKFNEKNRMPLQCAFLESSNEIIKLLIQQGAKIDIIILSN